MKNLEVPIIERLLMLDIPEMSGDITFNHVPNINPNQYQELIACIAKVKKELGIPQSNPLNLMYSALYYI